MLVWLFSLFILVPLAEVIILIRIGSHIGVLNTIAMVIAIGVIGAWLAKREGLRAILRIQTELAAGRLPTDSMIDGLLVLVAGVLMITPGILTDITGLLLLIPPIRALVRNQLKKRFTSKITFTHLGGAHPFQQQPDDFIDVEAEEKREQP